MRVRSIQCRSQVEGGSAPRPVKEGIAPPYTELSHFSNLKLKCEEHKKINLLFIQCTKKILYVDQEPP